VQELNGHTTVFVETAAGAYEPRAVDLGAASGGVIAVREGLKAGDRVVSRGAFVLKSQMLKSTLAEE
jgi:cobalt-zinc-cadmium efflux system membrane fusion protein